jgi:hypothetical protein
MNALFGGALLPVCACFLITPYGLRLLDGYRTPTFNDFNMVDVQTFEVGAALATFNIF